MKSQKIKQVTIKVINTNAALSGSSITIKKIKSAAGRIRLKFSSLTLNMKKINIDNESTTFARCDC
ncbi:hypothetical protein VNF293_31290 [Atlantibacter hermannii]